MAALLAIGWGATAAPAAQAKGHAHSASLQRLAAARIARHKVGRRYVYGAVGPATFDCSGLVIFAYHKAGIPLGKVRTTFQMWSRGHHIARTRLLPGDVVFVYSASHGHVGVYLGGGKFVHAPAPGRRVSIGILPRQGAGYYGATRL
ncbi:MAG: C40 family peptidase [Thermoleophilia bacterium]|nr:C40 family peptidase [Thermoleophilia bacterium]